MSFSFQVVISYERPVQVAEEDHFNDRDEMGKITRSGYGVWD